MPSKLHEGPVFTAARRNDVSLEEYIQTRSNNEISAVEDQASISYLETKFTHYLPRDFALSLIYSFPIDNAGGGFCPLLSSLHSSGLVLTKSNYLCYANAVDMDTGNTSQSTGTSCYCDINKSVAKAMNSQISIISSIMQEDGLRHICSESYSCENPRKSLLILEVNGHFVSLAPGYERDDHGKFVSYKELSSEERLGYINDYNEKVESEQLKDRTSRSYVKTLTNLCIAGKKSTRDPNSVDIQDEFNLKMKSPHSESFDNIRKSAISSIIGIPYQLALSVCNRLEGKNLDICSFLLTSKCQPESSIDSKMIDVILPDHLFKRLFEFLSACSPESATVALEKVFEELKKEVIRRSGTDVEFKKQLRSSLDHKYGLGFLIKKLRHSSLQSSTTFKPESDINDAVIKSMSEFCAKATAKKFENSDDFKELTRDMPSITGFSFHSFICQNIAGISKVNQQTGESAEVRTIHPDNFQNVISCLTQTDKVNTLKESQKVTRPLVQRGIPIVRNENPQGDEVSAWRAVKKENKAIAERFKKQRRALVLRTLEQSFSQFVPQAKINKLNEAYTNHGLSSSCYLDAASKANKKYDRSFNNLSPESITVSLIRDSFSELRSFSFLAMYLSLIKIDDWKELTTKEDNKYANSIDYLILCVEDGDIDGSYLPTVLHQIDILVYLYRMYTLENTKEEERAICISQACNATSCSKESIAILFKSDAMRQVSLEEVSNEGRKKMAAKSIIVSSAECGDIGIEMFRPTTYKITDFLSKIKTLIPRTALTHEGEFSDVADLKEYSKKFEGVSVSDSRIDLEVSSSRVRFYLDKSATMVSVKDALTSSDQTRRTNYKHRGLDLPQPFAFSRLVCAGISSETLNGLADLCLNNEDLYFENNGRGFSIPIINMSEDTTDDIRDVLTLLAGSETDLQVLKSREILMGGGSTKTTSSPSTLVHDIAKTAVLQILKSSFPKASTEVRDSGSSHTVDIRLNDRLCIEICSDVEEKIRVLESVYTRDKTDLTVLVLSKYDILSQEVQKIMKEVVYYSIVGESRPSAAISSHHDHQLIMTQRAQQCADSSYYTEKLMTPGLIAFMSNVRMMKKLNSICSVVHILRSLERIEDTKSQNTEEEKKQHMSLKSEVCSRLIQTMDGDTDDRLQFIRNNETPSSFSESFLKLSTKIIDDHSRRQMSSGTKSSSKNSMCSDVSVIPQSDFNPFDSKIVYEGSKPIDLILLVDLISRKYSDSIDTAISMTCSNRYKSILRLAKAESVNSKAEFDSVLESYDSCFVEKVVVDKPGKLKDKSSGDSRSNLRKVKTFKRVAFSEDESSCTSLEAFEVVSLLMSAKAISPGLEHTEAPVLASADAVRMIISISLLQESTDHLVESRSKIESRLKSLTKSLSVHSSQHKQDELQTFNNSFSKHTVDSYFCRRCQECREKTSAIIMNDKQYARFSFKIERNNRRVKGNHTSESETKKEAYVKEVLDEKLSGRGRCSRMTVSERFEKKYSQESCYSASLSASAGHQMELDNFSERYVSHVKRLTSDFSDMSTFFIVCERAFGSASSEALKNVYRTSRKENSESSANIIAEELRRHLVMKSNREERYDLNEEKDGFLVYESGQTVEDVPADHTRYLNKNVDTDIIDFAMASEEEIHPSLIHEILTSKELAMALVWKVISSEVSKNRNSDCPMFVNFDREDLTVKYKQFGMANMKDKGHVIVTYIRKSTGHVYFTEKWTYADIIHRGVAYLRILAIMSTNLLSKEFRKLNPIKRSKMMKLHIEFICSNSWGVSKPTKVFRYYVQNFCANSSTINQTFMKLVKELCTDDSMLDGQIKMKDSLKNKKCIKMMLELLRDSKEEFGKTPLFGMPDYELGFETCLVNLSCQTTVGSKAHLNRIMKDTYDEYELSKNHFDSIKSIYIDSEEIFEACCSSSDTPEDFAMLRERVSKHFDLIDKIADDTDGRFTFSPLSIVLIYPQIVGLAAKINRDLTCVPSLKDLCTARSSFDPRSLRTRSSAENMMDISILTGSTSVLEIGLKILSSRLVIDLTFKMFDKEQAGGDREISIMSAIFRVIQCISENTCRAFGKETGIDMLDDPGKASKVNDSFQERIKLNSIFFSADQTRWGPNFNTSTFSLMMHAMSPYHTQAFLPALITSLCEYKIFETSYSVRDFEDQTTHRVSVPGMLCRFHMGQGIFHFASSLYHSLVSSYVTDHMSSVVSLVKPGKMLTSSEYVTSDDLCLMLTSNINKYVDHQEFENFVSDQLSKPENHNSSDEASFDTYEIIRLMIHFVLDQRDAEMDRISRRIGIDSNECRGIIQSNSKLSKASMPIRELIESEESGTVSFIKRYISEKAKSTDMIVLSGPSSEKISKCASHIDEISSFSKVALSAVIIAIEHFSVMSTRDLLTYFLKNYTSSLMRYFGIKSSDYKNIISKTSCEFNTMYLYDGRVSSLSQKFAYSLIEPRTTGDFVDDLKGCFNTYASCRNNNMSQSQAHCMSLLSFVKVYNAWHCEAQDRYYPSLNSLNLGLEDISIVDPLVSVSHETTLHHKTLIGVSNQIRYNTRRMTPDQKKVFTSIERTIRNQKTRSDVLKSHFIRTSDAVSYTASIIVDGKCKIFSKGAIAASMAFFRYPVSLNLIPKSKYILGKSSLQKHIVKNPSRAEKGSCVAYLHVKQQQKSSLDVDQTVSALIDVDEIHHDNLSSVDSWKKYHHVKKHPLPGDYVRSTVSSSAYEEIVDAVKRFSNEDGKVKGSVGCLTTVEFKSGEREKAFFYRKQHSIDFSILQDERILKNCGFAPSADKNCRLIQYDGTENTQTAEVNRVMQERSDLNPLSEFSLNAAECLSDVSYILEGMCDYYPSNFLRKTQLVGRADVGVYQPSRDELITANMITAVLASDPVEMLSSSNLEEFMEKLAIPSSIEATSQEEAEKLKTSLNETLSRVRCVSKLTSWASEDDEEKIKTAIFKLIDLADEKIRSFNKVSSESSDDSESDVSYYDYSSTEDEEDEDSFDEAAFLTDCLRILREKGQPALEDFYYDLTDDISNFCSSLLAKLASCDIDVEGFTSEASKRLSEIDKSTKRIREPSVIETENSSGKPKDLYLSHSSKTLSAHFNHGTEAVFASILKQLINSGNLILVHNVKNQIEDGMVKFHSDIKTDKVIKPEVRDLLIDKYQSVSSESRRRFSQSDFESCISRLARQLSGKPVKQKVASSKGTIAILEDLLFSDQRPVISNSGILYSKPRLPMLSNMNRILTRCESNRISLNPDTVIHERVNIDLCFMIASGVFRDFNLMCRYDQQSRIQRYVSLASRDMYEMSRTTSNCLEMSLYYSLEKEDRIKLSDSIDRLSEFDALLHIIKVSDLCDIESSEKFNLRESLA